MLACVKFCSQSSKKNKNKNILFELEVIGSYKK